MADIKIEETQVFGLQASIRAMRNPHANHSKSDSFTDLYCEEIRIENLNIERFKIGEKDANLSRRLTKAGSEHCKHLRFIQVWADLTLPRYILTELDTYKHTEKLSCSTMHTLTKQKLTEDNFYGQISKNRLYDLNVLLEKYNKLSFSKDNSNGIKQELFMAIKNDLPESFLQKRTFITNYQQLLNIYYQRRGHRLPQWKIICEWILSLPYFVEITGINVPKKHTRNDSTNDPSIEPKKNDSYLDNFSKAIRTTGKGLTLA